MKRVDYLKGHMIRSVYTANNKLLNDLKQEQLSGLKDKPRTRHTREILWDVWTLEK